MIHEEIMAMPMQYNTIVGSLGMALSGGQKQRVLLARALPQAQGALPGRSLRPAGRSARAAHQHRAREDPTMSLVIVSDPPETASAAAKKLELASTLPISLVAPTGAA